MYFFVIILYNVELRIQKKNDEDSSYIEIQE